MASLLWFGDSGRDDANFCVAFLENHDEDSTGLRLAQRTESLLTVRASVSRKVEGVFVKYGVFGLFGVDAVQGDVVDVGIIPVEFHPIRLVCTIILIKWGGILICQSKPMSQLEVHSQFHPNLEHPSNLLHCAAYSP